MLRFHYLYEDYDLAAKALSLWMPGDCRKALEWFRISANAIYALKTPQGDMRFLRLSPASEKRPENLRAESDYIDYLAGNGYPVARMLPSRGGAPVEMLEYKGEVWYACCFESAPGERSDRIEWNDDIAFRYGEALARLHDLSAKYAPVGARTWSWKDTLRRATDLCERSGAGEAVRISAERIAAELDALDEPAEAFGLCHCDFEPDNVFFQNGQPHVIDFESGLYFFYAYDVYVALNALDDAVAEEQVPAMAEKVLAGYESVRRLNRDLLDCRALQRFGDIRELGNLYNCLSDPAKPDDPEWAADLRKHLQNAAAVRTERLREYAEQ